MKTKILQDMKLLAEQQAFDVNSCFLQSLEDHITKMERPVHNVGSAYQQKKYFSANLPYVVSRLLTHFKLYANNIMHTNRNQFGIQLVHIACYSM